MTVPKDLVQSWLPYRREKDSCELRLWTFHWFGASASAYGTWEWCMSDEVELCAVQLPGREDRKDQSPYRSVKDAASDLVENLKPMFAEKPYALFGHSSGSWIAYEVALALRREGLPAPSIFIVSDFPAPQTPLDLRPWKVSKDLSEKEFQQEVLGWGLPEFSPLLRDEFAQFDEYEFNADDEPLACPISAYLSQEDPKVGPKGGNPELMEGWASLSTHLHMSVCWASLSSHLHMSVDVFFGNHFYLQDSVIQKEVAKTIGDRMTKLADLLTFDF
eukprot:CAMPEP_0114252412 /NCGR_PEP_ID=MMETSP0058-20121206/15823_1 /TAXON_ID=36894 /ORGANISM="Pyramimonas parkeae, CCMP726" /LENGTH=274 /DNA_ID=CAMNT_0001366345 /DNA_START=70 /DNA_END=895 /DNA_ORIENTATION=+